MIAEKLVELSITWPSFAHALIVCLHTGYNVVIQARNLVSCQNQPHQPGHVGKCPLLDVIDQIIGQID